MSNLADAAAKVRSYLGDFAQPFTATFAGMGTDNGSFDLPETQISEYTLLHLADGVTTILIDGEDYEVDRVTGVLLMGQDYRPLPSGATLIFNGKTYGMFSDDEIAEFVHDAVLMHTGGREKQERYRDQSGFIRYSKRNLTVEDLPEEEILPVALLATVEALWRLTTDASTDVDIHTPDGTAVPRSQRYAQMRNQITVLEDRYREICAQMNVGLYKVETLNLRRVSRTTGRLVPIFESREYDDYGTPRRILPPVDTRYADESDIPSSINTGFGW